ncbi:MAG: LysM peptidoglycan-binding domain-containing protein [Coprobacillus sp.]|nr:LysM peptidoglycan-binding domain-containing protein [Coprobacillus sp.]
MQKIYFKKVVDLNHQLKELISISVDESINYKMENQGMRAYGSIMINGDYKDENMKKEFRENIDLDILAQFSKIEDKNEFNVKVEDFDYYLNDGNLSLVIQASIYGVKDDEDRVIETDRLIENEEVHDEDISDEIESLIREQDEVVEEVQTFNEPQIEVEKIIEDMPKVTQEVKKAKKEEINDEDDNDIGTYYLYVVQDGDSYRSIAERYQVDEYMIQNYNHNRDLSKGTIVIVPYIA